MFYIYSSPHAPTWTLVVIEDFSHDVDMPAACRIYDPFVILRPFFILSSAVAGVKCKLVKR